MAVATAATWEKDQIRLSIAVSRPKTPGRGFGLVLVATLALATSVTSAGVAAATEPPLPTPEALPADVVVFVAHVPSSLGRLTKAEFQRALVQAAAEVGRSSAPGPHAKDYPRIANRALAERLDAIWIQGQAMEMGIGVRPPEISRELAHLKKEAFKNEAQYRRFLREAHFTDADVRERVEIQILSEKIQLRVIFGLSEAEAQRVFRRFVKQYATRWQGRTVCAPGYVTVRCSNGPAPAGP
jgi:SurA-like protein